MPLPQLINSDAAAPAAGTVSYDFVYRGTWGNDLIYGSSYADLIYGYDGNDTIYGGHGSDTLNGGSGRDYLSGGSGHDDLYGGSGSDRLVGGDGLDNLYGGNGNDFLAGGAHSDYLYGGYGADRFVFTQADVIYQDAWNDYIDDFYHSDGDIIDVSRIDAVAGGRDNAFFFIGTDEFSGQAGEMRYENTADATFVEMDTDGDGHYDYFIELNGSFDLWASDFVL